MKVSIKMQRGSVRWMLSGQYPVCCIEGLIEHGYTIERGAIYFLVLSDSYVRGALKGKASYAISLKIDGALRRLRIPVGAPVYWWLEVEEPPR